MIWTVTTNPALDMTYEVETLTVGHVHRAAAPTVLPGGKGLNVSRVLAQRGIPSVATGFIGGETGAAFLDLLAEYRLVDPRFISTDAPTRRSISITDSHGGTVLNETGEPQSQVAFDQLNGQLARGLHPGDVVALSGSFPPATSDEQVEALVSTIVATGAILIVDTSGAPLAAAARAGAHVLKPNDIELEALTGSADLDAGITALLEAGAKLVVCSRGEHGITAGHHSGTRVHVPVTEKISGNPTGAGDSLVAGLATHLQLGLDPAAEPDVLRAWLADAAALAGATVAWPTAGGFDETVYDRLKGSVC